MIGYLRYRRECITALERPSLRVWLISTAYTIKARALHKLGRHTYRIRPIGTSNAMCTWCGHRRSMGSRG